MFGRRVFIALLAPYVVWLVLAYDYHFLDGVNLAFHEAGHLILGFGGRTLHFLGGTFGQLFFPAACIFHFLSRGGSFEAGVCGIWLGESLMNVARYMADARAQELPLVGGHVHDWNWLLGQAGLLHRCELLGGLLHLFASAIVIAAWLWALRQSMSGRELEAAR